MAKYKITLVDLEQKSDDVLMKPQYTVPMVITAEGADLIRMAVAFKDHLGYDAHVIEKLED